MKTLLLSLMLCIPIISIAQNSNQKTLARLIITDGWDEDQILTPVLLKVDAFTVFYKPEKGGHIMMANVWPGNESQSYGWIENFRVRKNEKQSTEKSFIAVFDWHYRNNYNEQRGTAKIKLVVDKKPGFKIFTMYIMTADLDLITYKGYVEGSFRFEL